MRHTPLTRIHPPVQASRLALAACLCLAGGAALAQQQAATLPAVTVTGDDESSPRPPQPPSYKFTAPLQDTPRSITVVPQEVLREQNVTTFSDALRTVPGITFLGGDAAANPSADRPVIRGFESRNSIFVNGMRDSGLQNRESFAVEHISVIKGADSVYAGRGSVGGSVDVKTKTPQKDDFVAGSVGLGTDGYKRATLDVNRVIGDGVAVRLNAMGHDAAMAGRNNVDSRRWGVAPSISFGLNSPTTVTLSYYHLTSRDMPDFSLPFGADGRPIASDRRLFYGLLDRDRRKGQTDTGEIRVEHKLDGNWKIRNTTAFGRSTLDYVATNPQFVANTGNQVIGLQAKSGNYSTNAISNQTELAGETVLWGMKHSMAVGLELGGEKNHYAGYLVSDAAGNNIRSGGPCTVAYNCTPLGTWNPRNPWTGSLRLNGDLGFPGPMTRTRTTTASLYAFDTVTLSPRWLLSAGLRFDRYDTKATQDGVADMKNTSNLVNGQLGVVFKPVDTLSLYASWGSSSNPPGSNGGLGGGNDQITGRNQDLSPERTTNLEVGAKWEVLERRLALTSALFQTEKRNARVSDGSGGIVNAGSQRVRGLELGAAGKLTRAWSLFGGYTYMNAITTDAGPASPSASGLPMVMVPKHSLTLWSSHQVLPQLTLGAGVTAMSKVYASVSPTAHRWTPGYMRLDLAATYRINKAVDLRLNVQNATDKHYFASAYPIYASWAPGRSATLTLDIHP